MCDDEERNNEEYMKSLIEDDMKCVMCESIHGEYKSIEECLGVMYNIELPKKRR